MCQNVLLFSSFEKGLAMLSLAGLYPLGWTDPPAQHPEWLLPQPYTPLWLSSSECTGCTLLTSSDDGHFACPICRLLRLTCYEYTSTKVCSRFCFQFFKAHVHGRIKPSFIFPMCMCAWCACKSVAWVHRHMWYMCVETRQ